MDLSSFPPGYTYPKEMRNLNAFEIVAEIGCGWNLGDTLESEKDETSMGNPITTKAMIDKIHEQGFTALRVPVAWNQHYKDSTNYIIDDAFMNRVETVLNYGLSNGMYVIVNMHCLSLENMITENKRIQNSVKSEITAIWTQVANRFKDYGDKLIFETVDRAIFVKNGIKDYIGKLSYFNIVNSYNEAARQAIRGTGGNNENRLILLSTYNSTCLPDVLNGWKTLSDDKMIAASFHVYRPLNFVRDGHLDYTEDDEQELIEHFEKFQNFVEVKKVPIVIIEFSALNKDNLDDRFYYAKQFSQLAHSQNIPIFWWDNGRFDYAIFDRNKCIFTFEDIANVIIDPSYE